MHPVKAQLKYKYQQFSMISRTGFFASSSAGYNEVTPLPLVALFVCL